MMDRDVSDSARMRGRPWPWGALALGLALMAWGALAAAVFAFAASFGSPGDGNHGMQAMQYWILAALGVLGGSMMGSAVSVVLAWRLRRGPVCATIAGLLLTLLVFLMLIVLGATCGPSLAAAEQTIWQAAGSRG